MSKKNETRKEAPHQANVEEAQPGTTILNRRKQKATAKAAMIKTFENAELICCTYLADILIDESGLEPVVPVDEVKATIEALRMFREGLNSKLKY